MIYLLHNDPAANAQMLDDATLNKQIKAIAQTLCAVHSWAETRRAEREGRYVSANHRVCYPDYSRIPLKRSNLVHNKMGEWARACLANYLKLVEMGRKCFFEWNYRFNDYDDFMLWKSERIGRCNYQHKMQKVVEWCFDNVPDIPDGNLTPFPLCLPKKYRTEMLLQETIKSYRNYYIAKIPKNVKWTKRQQPDFVTRGTEVINERN